MSNTNTRFVIEQDGHMYRENVTRQAINLQPQLERVFQSNATFKVTSVADMAQIGAPNFGNASLTCCASNAATAWWSVRINTFTLRTKFWLRGGVLTPAFSGDDALMEMHWTPPTNLRLVLGIICQFGSRGCSLGKHYLVAYDADGSTFRLPLANLYDHLELCHGQETVWYPTMMAALLSGLRAFNNSVWNNDLNGEFQKERAPKMFSWKPSNTGFDQLPIEARHWSDLCEKVSNDLINKNMQPV